MKRNNENLNEAKEKLMVSPDWPSIHESTIVKDANGKTILAYLSRHRRANGHVVEDGVPVRQICHTLHDPNATSTSVHF